MNKQEFIYVISTQRGQGSPEIYSFWNTYEGAIKAYHKLLVNNKHGHYDFDFEFTMNNYFLYKFPANTYFCEGDNSSDIKLQKSCKYRVKFKSYEELEKEFNMIIRANKLERVTNDRTE